MIIKVFGSAILTAIIIGAIVKLENLLSEFLGQYQNQLALQGASFSAIALIGCGLLYWLARAPKRKSFEISTRLDVQNLAMLFVRGFMKGLIPQSPSVQATLRL